MAKKNASSTPAETDPIHEQTPEVTSMETSTTEGETDFGSSLLDESATEPNADPEPQLTEPVAEPVVEPEPAMQEPTEELVAPAPVEQAPELDPASLDRITTVMIQTGASKSGAEKMLAKMTNTEKQMLAESITEQEGQLRIADSAKYFTAFESYNDRVYKASTEPVPEPADFES